MTGGLARARSLWMGPGGRSVLDHATSMVGNIWRHPENRGMRVRRLATWLGWQAWERTVARPCVVDLHDGVRLVCRPHDQVTSLAMYFGLYDSQEMRFLLAWLRPGDTFLDVGANVAPYSLLTTLVHGVRAVAFEPGTQARERAEANIRLNGAADRVELVPAAVSADDGTAHLTVGRWAMNSLVDDSYHGDVEDVPTISLDSFVRRRQVRGVSLVKVDVEGHEPDVLRGAARLIDEEHPALIVECNHLQALQDVAKRHGYRPVSFAPDTATLDETVWPAEGANNVILVPDLAAARVRVGDHRALVGVGE